MIDTLYIKLEDSGLLAPAFQKGVRIETDGGISLSCLFKDHLGFASELIDRIGTLFLDGRPVDDLSTAIVSDGSVLALSSAMPGLVGATMRRSGALASFRSGISHHAEDSPPAKTSKKASVYVKLFNTMINDAGPLFIRHGFYARSADLVQTLQHSAYSLENAAPVIFITSENHRA